MVVDELTVLFIEFRAKFKHNLREMLKEVGDPRSLVVYDLDSLLGGKSGSRSGGETANHRTSMAGDPLANYGLRNTDELEVGRYLKRQIPHHQFMGMWPMVSMVVAYCDASSLFRYRGVFRGESKDVAVSFH